MRTWNMLTDELDDPNSVPRMFLAEAFPTLRPVQTEYRTSVGPIQIERGQANPGTLGTAFDIWVQLKVTPRPQLSTAAAGARRAGADAANAQQQLMSALGSEGSPGPQAGPLTGPTRNLGVRDLLRLAWANALLVEVFRTGMVMPGSPLADSPLSSAEDLLALASELAVDELTQLTKFAEAQLLPRLRDLTEAGPTSTGPTFVGSALMPADADLVVGHTSSPKLAALGQQDTAADSGAGEQAPQHRRCVDQQHG